MGESTPRSGNTTTNNTIVAQNTAGTGATAGFSDVSGSLNTASGFDLIGTGGAGGLTSGVNGNQVGVSNPGLATTSVTTTGGTKQTIASLANNGGPTQTIALLAGSPALNAGSNALAVDANGNPLLYDQRGPGFPRIVDLTVDIGAYERAPETTINVQSSVNPAIAGETVTFTATVTATFANLNVPTGTVTFFDGASELGTATLVKGTASFSTSALFVGTDAITAVYSGDTIFANSTSPTLTETVNQTTTTTSTTPVTISATTASSTAAAAASTATLTSKDHKKAVKKIVSSKHALPHGGSSTRFHQTEKIAALKRSVEAITAHVKVKVKKK